MSKTKKKEKTILQKTKIQIIFILTAIILLIVITDIYITYFQGDNQQKSIDDNNDLQIIDDTISPIGLKQAVSLEIKRVHKKGLEQTIRKIGNDWKQPPTYFIEVILDGARWTSKILRNWDSDILGWEPFKFVEDEQEECLVTIKIIEQRKNLFQTYNVEMENIRLNYNFKSGRWVGDDYFIDNDGYGHYDGIDFEIWFEVHQLDGDNDGIPYWTEVNILKTDPDFDDSKLDPDCDGIPTSWEWKWKYNPFIFNNHTTLDTENDGLSNIEEYTLRKWLSNPYHKDIYLEVDFMEKGPGLFANEHIFWEESQSMLIDKFTEHNITIHIDDGWPGGPTNGGGEYLKYFGEYIGPFDGLGGQFYKYHFCDERKGLFRYVFITHKGGWNYAQDYKLWCDVICIPSNPSYYFKVFFPPAITPKLQRLAMSVAVMHELGHSLNLNPHYHNGIDNSSQAGRNNLPLLQKIKAKREANEYWDSYESVMNYNKFSLYVLDYSDGTHGIRDNNDWKQIDLTYFQRKSDEDFGIDWKNN